MTCAQLQTSSTLVKLPGHPRLEPAQRVKIKVWSPRRLCKESARPPAKQAPLTYADISTGGRLIGLGGWGRTKVNAILVQLHLNENVASIGSLKDELCTSKACQTRCMNTFQSDTHEVSCTPAALSFSLLCFQSVSPALLRFALDHMCTAPDQLDSGQAAWPPQAGACFTCITQCTLHPLEEFEGDCDCNERQLEKDIWEIRRVELKPMGAPPVVFKTESIDVICPIALALNVFPVTLGAQRREG